ncbi:MAG: DUF4160 domain-containing protein [Phaeodactylibacter sp.]|nr:DUF4160 domain-containing protein [Phaeodactylibacter sp.]
MPIIGKIKGIILRMFFGDHPPPHFHATNDEKNGLFKIDDSKMFKGNLSSKDQKKLSKWAKPRKKKLKKMWDTQDIHEIE